MDACLIFVIAAYLRGYKASDFIGQEETMTVGEVSQMLLEFDARKEEVRRQLDGYKSQVTELTSENERLVKILQQKSPQSNRPYKEPSSEDNVIIDYELYSHCDYVFIDGGANVGDTLFTFSGEKDEEIVEMRNEIFEQHNVTSEDFCIFGFEGNPRFTGILKKAEAKLSEKAKLSKIFTATVLNDREGATKLYISPTHHGSSIEWRKTTGKIRKRNFEVVSSVDIVSFLEQFQPKVIFLKLNIEGAEFRVLSHLLSHGSFCRWSAAKYIAVQYHIGIKAAPVKYRDIEETFEGVVHTILEDQCNATVWSLPQTELEEALRLNRLS